MADEDSEDFKAAQKIAARYLGQDPNNIDEADLPKEWDWRNVSGYDFTTPLKDQKGCGSCYTMSFIASIESRLKIQTG